MYIVCILYVYYMYIICILYVCYMYIICILYVYYMYIICIYIYACLYVYMPICLHMYKCKNVPTYVHIFIHIHCATYFVPIHCGNKLSTSQWKGKGTIEYFECFYWPIKIGTFVLGCWKPTLNFRWLLPWYSGFETCNLVAGWRSHKAGRGRTSPSRAAPWLTTRALYLRWGA